MAPHKKHFTALIIVILITTYIGLHLHTLTTFPYVHSDESWLSGFSRTVLDKGTFKTSEPFFDLYPRAIHGLRLIFVSIQIFFIKLLGYKLFSLRLISLIFSLSSLGLIYKYFRYRQRSALEALILTGIIGTMNQFVMMSHLARQEPLILFGMVLAFYLAQKKQTPYSPYIITAVIGLCIGVHPNSFLIGCSIGLLYLYRYFFKRGLKKPIIQYVLLLAIWALGFIGLSFYLNPNFINDYLAFGTQLGVVNYSINRLQGFIYYYYKLYEQIGGTYVLVNIKFNLLIIAVGLIFTIIYIILNRKKEDLSALVSSLLMVVAINFGLFIIGRYNQTAIIFPLIWGWILIFEYLFLIQKKIHHKQVLNFLLCGLLILQMSTTYNTLKVSRHEDYDIFGRQITSIIPANAKVLGNLNMDYHLNLYQLYDVRNLDYLDENNLDIQAYIKKNDITYVVLYEEMSYIYDAGGKWDILYGNLAYYKDLVTYLNTHGDLLKTFEAPTYGMRIAKYVDGYPWSVKIYQLEE